MEARLNKIYKYIIFHGNNRDEVESFADLVFEFSKINEQGVKYSCFWNKESDNYVYAKQGDYIFSEEVWIEEEEYPVKVVTPKQFRNNFYQIYDDK